MDIDLPMTHNTVSGHTTSKLAQELFNSYSHHRLTEITSRRFTQTDMLRWLEPFERKGVFEKTEIGRSAEGRPINLLRIGAGSTKVLLWSQMHGDEATATMAMLDMIRFFFLNPELESVRTMRSNLAILMIPMLNPDGAERFQRRTAQQIDMNRDGLSLSTPEARILKEQQQKFQPEFGFNLHDQDPRYTVGNTKNVAAIALLAPSIDVDKTDTAVRRRAKHVAALFGEVMNLFVPGHVARYDDVFEPRAFGDNVQRWGTSTVLVESGGWPNDREKMFLRKLNYVGLLTVLDAIARGQYDQAAIATYEALPFNTKNLYDVIIRKAQYKASMIAPPVMVDIGINIDEVTDPATKNRELRGTIVDIGELSGFGAFEEYEAAKVMMDDSAVALEKKISLDEMRRLILSK